MLGWPVMQFTSRDGAISARVVDMVPVLLVLGTLSQTAGTGQPGHHVGLAKIETRW